MRSRIGGDHNIFCARTKTTNNKNLIFLYSSWKSRRSRRETVTRFCILVYSKQKKENVKYFYFCVA